MTGVDRPRKVATFSGCLFCLVPRMVAISLVLMCIQAGSVAAWNAATPRGLRSTRARPWSRPNDDYLPPSKSLPTAPKEGFPHYPRRDPNAFDNPNHQMTNTDWLNNHPLTHVKDIFGSIEFHKGEDLFGQFEKPKLSQAQKMEEKVKSARRRKESMWDAFKGTLPDEEQGDPFDMVESPTSFSSSDEPAPTSAAAADLYDPGSIPTPEDWSARAPDNKFDMTPVYQSTRIGKAFSLGAATVQSPFDGPAQKHRVSTPATTGAQNSPNNAFRSPGPKPQAQQSFFSSAYAARRTGSQNQKDPSWWQTQPKPPG